jgi:hypothetical protein
VQAFEGDTLETRMSLLQKQLGFGDACTFRLIEKNVVSLLPPSKDGLKRDAARALTDLIRYTTRRFISPKCSHGGSCRDFTNVVLSSPSFVCMAGHINTLTTCCTEHTGGTSLLQRML